MVATTLCRVVDINPKFIAGNYKIRPKNETSQK